MADALSNEVQQRNQQIADTAKARPWETPQTPYQPWTTAAQDLRDRLGKS